MLILDPRTSHNMLSGLSALNLNTPIVTFMETLNLVCLHCVTEVHYSSETSLFLLWRLQSHQ
jgi:hypothetical protein